MRLWSAFNERAGLAMSMLQRKQYRRAVARSVGVKHRGDGMSLEQEEKIK